MGLYLNIAITISCFKSLFLETYKSTDFEVHRNWLAITHSLPLKQWYFESTSEWTLDYPPLFAWFEYFLSHIAVLWDPGMVKVENLNYESKATILFQRLSVILSDTVFIYAAMGFCTNFVRSNMRTSSKDFDRSSIKNPRLILYCLLVFNCGLLIVDHIHFQYNGMLYGMLLLSVTKLYNLISIETVLYIAWRYCEVCPLVAGIYPLEYEVLSLADFSCASFAMYWDMFVMFTHISNSNLEGAFWFAVLLNFKHLYLYVAPAYFVYLLRCYCFKTKPGARISWSSFSIVRFISLGIIVAGVFILSLGPFVYLGQGKQLIARLFPFKRGLCHAYWAPNFWALYNVADKGAVLFGKYFGLLDHNITEKAVMTGGLVQEFNHIVLPTVTPLVTLILTVLSMLPSLVKIWCNPRSVPTFVRGLVLCAFASFLFGWHVHEKAVLLVIVPLSLLVFEKRCDCQVYLLLSTVGYYSLFPLIFTKYENVMKILLLLIHVTFAFSTLGIHYRSSWNWRRLPLMSSIESVYLLGIVPLEVYNSLIHHYVLHLSETLPFLPLLLTSLYCSVGVLYCWLKFYWNTLTENSYYNKQS